MAVPFDPQRLEVTGAAVPVVEGVLQSTSTEPPSTAFLLRDRWSMFRERSIGPTQAGVGQSQWGRAALGRPCARLLIPRLSPDGRRVAVEIAEQETQVWLYDLSRETLTRLTFEGTCQQCPAWTPDGKRIAFNSNKEGPVNIFWQLADGSGGLERLTTSELPQCSEFLVPGWATAGLQ